jgi:multidrug transporter EmrE-like cation transporter
MNPWLVLAAAILVEVAGTLCLKVASDATTFADRVAPGIGVAIFYGSTLVLMAITMKSLDVGITYTVWAGVGTALVTLAGIVLFNESFAWPKLVGVALVAAGVMVLHSVSRH